MWSLFKNAAFWKSSFFWNTKLIFLFQKASNLMLHDKNLKISIELDSERLKDVAHNTTNLFIKNTRKFI